MKVDNSFFNEEIRSDFLVSEKRKKIWHTELQLLETFDSVCKKYNLKYYAEFGTLLGAVRHGGFIPWDDDIDIIMFRDDYMKLQEIAADEFKEPYFFQNSYTDLVLWSISKLRDSRTTAIEFKDMDPEFNQGIFIDIYPYDDVPDQKNFSENILNVQREVWQTVVNAERMKYYLSQGVSFHTDSDILYDLLNLPVRERFRQFELLNSSHYGTSENVQFITHAICHGIAVRKRDWFSETVYLPFEYLTIPAPAGYDQILTIQYGDYHQYLMGGSAHEGIFWDPDRPYLYYMEHPEKLP